MHDKTSGAAFSYVPPLPEDVREVLEREGMMYYARQRGTLPVTGNTL
jgi:hypothetical protein